MQLPQGRREGQKRSPREGLRSMAGTQPLPSFTEAGTQILESEVPCLSHRVVSGREDSQATWLQLRVFSSPPSLSPRSTGWAAAVSTTKALLQMALLSSQIPRRKLPKVHSLCHETRVPEHVYKSQRDSLLRIVIPAFTCITLNFFVLFRW